VSSLRHAIYIVGLSVFLGIHSLFLIIHTISMREKLGKGVFHPVTIFFTVEEVSCSAHENSLQVRNLLSKRRVVRPMSILSK